MRWARASALLVAVLLPAACSDRTLPPAGQLVVHIDTDAPLVSGLPVDARQTLGLFDRLRVEVLAPSAELACAECRREFVVTREQLDAGSLSFGVVLPPPMSDAASQPAAIALVEGFRVRLRLFTSVGLFGDRPRADASIDAIFSMPAHPDEGVLEVTAFLSFDRLGVPTNLRVQGDAPLAGRVIAGRRAVPVDRPMCPAPARAGEVCVPGGVFWVGRSFAVERVLRAAVMTPFYMDEKELTVAELRASGVVTGADPKRTSGVDAGCTYTDLPGSTDDLPATCISHALAQAACASRGARLPTLTQMQYVRGRLEGSDYVWGLDPPTCEDAVWGRDPLNEDICLSFGSRPQRAGTGTRDRLLLPSGDITDLAGNVAEWTADSDSGDECNVPGVVRDPVCTRLPGAVAGSYASFATDLLSPVASFDHTEQDPRVGFRCVRPVAP